MLLLENVTPFELYSFALDNQKERLKQALAKDVRNDKEVSYLRKSVYILKQSLKC